MAGFESLEVWQLAHRLALSVYRATSSFPSDERFGLTSQLRRAASSVGANIAEGYGRNSRQDTSRFLSIARGSLMETRSFLYLSRDLRFLDGEDATQLLADVEQLSIKLSRAMQALACNPSLAVNEAEGEYRDASSDGVPTRDSPQP